MKREHKGFGHGLRPGTKWDINCPSCQRERAAAQAHAYLVRDALEEALEGTELAVAQLEVADRGYVIQVTDPGNGFDFKVTVEEGR